MSNTEDISSGAVVLHRLNATDVVAFGSPNELDLLGSTKATVDRPFVAAVRAAMTAAPQLGVAVDQFSGRVLRLTAEGARLLSQNESMRTSVITGVVRNPDTGRIAGQLTFIDPTSIAGLASSLPAIAGGAAMALQLARIEKALDGLKKDLTYLIRHEHLKIEAGIEANFEILQDVYATLQRRWLLEDDQWDRIANVEASVRAFHKETKKHLRSLDEALATGEARLTTRLAQLNRALDDERTLYWLRAHVHAELALARWEALYLVRQADQHPEELESLTTSMQQGLSDRYRTLAGLSERIVRYLNVGGVVSTFFDRIRLIRRARLKALLEELNDLLDVFPPAISFDESSSREPIPLGDGTPERTQWDHLVGAAKSLPQAAAPIAGWIGDRMSSLPFVRRRSSSSTALANAGIDCTGMGDAEEARE